MHFSTCTFNCMSQATPISFSTINSATLMLVQLQSQLWLLALLQTAILQFQTRSMRNGQMFEVLVCSHDSFFTQMSVYTFFVS